MTTRTGEPRPAMKVTLISTVKDCADAAGAFLASLATQTRAPDEVVIVDGGSSDGTADAFAGEGVTMLVEVGANISRGRRPPGGCTRTGRCFQVALPVRPPLFGHCRSSPDRQ